MDKLRKQELEHKIENASPLDFVSVLQEIEQYEKEETKAVIDDLYKEFKTEDDMIEKLVVPVFTSVIDGFLEVNSATRKLRKKGITASKLVSECSSFTYEQSQQASYLLDGYMEYKNIREITAEDFQEYGDDVRTQYKGNRNYWEAKESLDKYKNEKFENNDNKINAVDEYTGKKNVYKEQAHPDGRRNIKEYKHRNQAHVDHIEPLSKIHERLKGNYALSDEDITNIANADYNFALTAAYINNGTGVKGKGNKGDMTIPEFIADQEKRERNGEPHLGLTPGTKQRMMQEWKKANAGINDAVNKTTGKNITNLGSEQQKIILDKTSKNALKQSRDYMVGNIILFIIKPLYFELSDIFRNGLKEGVNAHTISDALQIRSNRIKKFVLNNALTFLGTSVWDFVKGFISSLIEGLISLFVGVFKQILKLIKEGIKVFVQAGKILFGEQSKQMTTAQKGDAIIKILGGSVITICGIGIEALINKLGIGEPWSVVLATMMSGIASVLFMFSLDRMDLFNARAETRQARIKDIFNERIKDIKDATTEMTKNAMDKLKQQRLEFNKSMVEFDKAVSCSNYTLLNEIVIKQAKLLGINLLQTTNNNKTNWSL